MNEDKSIYTRNGYGQEKKKGRVSPCMDPPSWATQSLTVSH